MNVPGVGRIPNIVDSLLDPIIPPDKLISGAVNAIKIGEAALDSGSRPLSDEERDIAEEHFGDSIDLDRITINESSALSEANQYFPGNNGSRPFVVGNTINYPEDIDLSDPGERGTFIHELVHVWQFQNTEGVNVQIKGAQLATDPENYEIDTSLLNDTDNFPEEFNIEQQAEIVRGYYLLQRHEELKAEKFDLFSDPVSDHSEQIEVIDEEIEQIENIGLFNDLNDDGITTTELEPFIEKIQSYTPQEGVVAELNEAADEFLESGANPIEIVEGGFEVGREIGEIALEETGNTIIDGVHAADDFIDDVKRFNPFG